MAKVPLQLGQEAREKVGQRVGTPAQVHLGPRSGVVDETLERPQDRPTRLLADGGSVQTEAQLSSGVRSDDRGPCVNPVERHDGVVAPVDDRHDRVRGPEVDANPHCARVYALHGVRRLVASRVSRRHRLAVAVNRVTLWNLGAPVSIFGRADTLPSYSSTLL